MAAPAAHSDTANTCLAILEYSRGGPSCSRFEVFVGDFLSH